MSRRFPVPALVLALALASPLAAQTLQPPTRELGRLPAAEIEYLAPSPDGRLVAMTAYSAEEQPTLWLFDRTTRQSTVLARGNDFDSPAWSPRGDRIAFGQEDETGAYRIYALPVDPKDGKAAGAMRRVSMSRGREPAFSPDGRSIAFAEMDADEQLTQMVVVPANGGAERRVGGRTGPISWVTWASDGWIYYGIRSAQGVTRDYRIERVHPADGRVQVVMRTPDSPWPGVTADSRLVGYVSGRGVGDNTLRTVARVDGTVIGEFLTHADIYGEAWSQSGYRLLGALIEQPQSLHVVRLDGGAPRRLMEDRGFTRRPTWSPDGRRIAFVEERDGRNVIGIHDVVGGEPQLAETTVEPGDFALSWSPDGRRIAFRSRDADTLAVLDVETGVDRALATAGRIGLHTWRADGRSIVFVRRRALAGPPMDIDEVALEGTATRLRSMERSDFSGTLRGVVVDNERTAYAVVDSVGLVAIPLDGGPSRTLVRGTHLRPFTSPDGRWIAAPVAPGRPRARATVIDVVPVAGGEPKRLSLGFGLVNPQAGSLRWHRDGRHLVAVGLKPGARHAQVFLVPLNGEPARAVADLYYPAEGADIDVSPDGTTVVYTRNSKPSARLIEIDLGAVIPDGGR